MATITSTAAAAGIQPKAVHAGVNAVHATYSLAASLSAGDVIQMVKVPNHARILYGRVNFNLGTPNTLTVTIGDGTTTTRYLGATSASNQGCVVFSALTMDYSYSAADTVDIVVTAVTSATATGSVNLTVLYTVDQAG